MRSDLCPNSFTVAAGGRGAGGNGRFTGLDSVACVFDCHSWRRLWALQPWKPNTSSGLFHRPPHFFLLPPLLLQLLKVAQPLCSDALLSLTPSALPSPVESGNHKQARSTEGAEDQQGNHLTHYLACNDTDILRKMSSLPRLQTSLLHLYSAAVLVLRH